jgi:hypothetical protein
MVEAGDFAGIEDLDVSLSFRWISVFVGIEDLDVSLSFRRISGFASFKGI